MFHYFFDVTANGDVREDTIGLKLFAHDVKREAARLAADMLHEFTRQTTPGWWLMEVRDEQGTLVGRVSFVLSGFEDPLRSIGRSMYR